MALADREKARHAASWCFTVALEIAAGIMAQWGEWAIVTLLFWGGMIALAAGYWPEIYEKVRGGKLFAFAFVKQIAVSAILVAAAYWGTIMAVAEYRYFSVTPPHTFPPEAWALQSRVFVKEEPSELVGLFKTYTDWRASEMVKPYIGKWYAIAGQVNDISAFPKFNVKGKQISETSMPRATLEARQNAFIVISLSFQDRWIPEAQNLGKGDKVSAYCQIAAINSYSIDLDHCQLVQR